MNQDFYRKLFLVVTAALLGWILLQLLQPIAAALAWGICLALLLEPAHVSLTRRLRGRPGLSAGIFTALLPIVLLGPITTLAIVFTNQISQLAEYVQQQPWRFDSNWMAKFDQYAVIGPVLRWIHENTEITTNQLQAALVSGAQVVLKSAAASGGNFVLGALGTILQFFLMLFLFFFLLRDGRAMLRRLLNLVPLSVAKRRELVEVVANTTRAVVYGTGLTALAQGALVGVAFAIAGLPSPVVFGVLAALLALLPAGGAALVWAPAVLWLAFDGSWGWALFMAIWGALVSLTDNFLRPLLISRHAPVSTLAVFVGVIGGVSAFGPIGIIVGPVLLTLIAAILRFAEKQVQDHA